MSVASGRSEVLDDGLQTIVVDFPLQLCIEVVDEFARIRRPRSLARESRVMSSHRVIGPLSASNASRGS